MQSWRNTTRHHIASHLTDFVRSSNLKMQRTNFSFRGDRERTFFVSTNCMDPLFTLGSERWTNSIPSGCIQEHKNSKAQRIKQTDRRRSKTFPGKYCQNRTKHRGPTSPTFIQPFPTPIEWSAIFAIGVYSLLVLSFSRQDQRKARSEQSYNTPRNCESHQSSHYIYNYNRPGLKT